MTVIARLQNGHIPTFLLVNVIEEFVTSKNDCCIVNLQRGLNVWLFQNLSESPSITSSSKANDTQACCKNASQFIVP